MAHDDLKPAEEPHWSQVKPEKWWSIYLPGTDGKFHEFIKPANRKPPAEWFHNPDCVVERRKE